MLSALTIQEIEERARTHIGHSRATFLIFSSYNGEKDGTNAEFLRRILDYHWQSGRLTDFHCIGYSQWERTPNETLGGAIQISTEFPEHFSYFYPQTFHKIREHVQSSLQGRWMYEGGIDILAFPAGSADLPICWNVAAIASSRKLVGGTFQDGDQLLRAIINMNEALQGMIEPHQMDVEINRRQFMHSFKRIASKAGPGIAGSIFKLIAK